MHGPRFFQAQCLGASLGALKRGALSIVPGQKISYAADALGRARAPRLARS